RRGGPDQAVHGRGTFSAAIGSGEEEVLSAQRNHAQGTLRSVVVYFQPTIIAVTQQSFPSSEFITNSQRCIRFSHSLPNVSSHHCFRDFSGGRLHALRIARRSSGVRPRRSFSTA